MDPATRRRKGSMMRIRTMAGLAVAGAATAAAVVGGVSYATADENEPTVRIVQEQPQPEDCPEKNGTAGTGL
jgi:hypothetical protein